MPRVIILYQFYVETHNLVCSYCNLCLYKDYIIILVVQPNYGGMIIDIVSREIKTPEQQSEALDAIRSTILDIVLIVVIGYDILSRIYCYEEK